MTLKSILEQKRTKTDKQTKPQQIKTNLVKRCLKRRIFIISVCALIAVVHLKL